MSLGTLNAVGLVPCALVLRSTTKSDSLDELSFQLKSMRADDTALAAGELGAVGGCAGGRPRSRWAVTRLGERTVP